jgi:hypothetical protein
VALQSSADTASTEAVPSPPSAVPPSSVDAALPSSPAAVPPSSADAFLSTVALPSSPTVALPSSPTAALPSSPTAALLSSPVFIFSDSATNSSSESSSESSYPSSPPISPSNASLSGLPFDFADDYADVNVRFIALIEKAKKYFGDDMLTASEYLQVDNNLPVMNAQTDEEIARGVNEVFERKEILKMAAKTLMKQKDAKIGSDNKIREDTEKTAEKKNDESFEHDNNINGTIALGDLVPVVEKIVKEIMETEKRKGKEKNKNDFPSAKAKEKTVECFFKKLEKPKVDVKK